MTRHSITNNLVGRASLSRDSVSRNSVSRDITRDSVGRDQNVRGRFVTSGFPIHLRFAVDGTDGEDIGAAFR